MNIQERLLKIIRDDNYAAGFQSLGQYRTALLQAARGEVEPAAVQEGPMQCSACQGKGYRVAPLDIMLTCPHCQGSGKCPASKPAEQQPGPDVEALVEALEAACDYLPIGSQALEKVRAALAFRRKQGGGHEKV